MSSSSQTPAASIAGHHPLSPEQTVVGGRRTRGRQQTDTDDSRRGTNYFTLKAQAELRNDATADSQHSGWSDRVRSGRRATDATVGQSRPGSSRAHPTSTTRDTAASSSSGHLSVPSKSPTPDRKLARTFGPVTTSQVLSTKWHELSDEQIKGAVSRYYPSDSASAPSDAYHAILRAMSAALDEVMQTNAYLEKTCESRELDERNRRGKVESMIEHLQPSEQAAARKVVDALVSDSNEARTIVKRPSFVVCDYLSLDLVPDS